ncbi:MAG: ATP-binding cassette domain-containing protein [Synechococcus sp.]
MHLAAGERVRWPDENFRAERSDLLANMDGLALFRIPADLALPGLPTDTVERLGLDLIATQDNSIAIQANANVSEGTRWLQRRLQRADDTTANTTTTAPSSVTSLLDAIHQRKLALTRTRVDNHTPLNAETEAALFRSLEQSQSTLGDRNTVGSAHQALLQCIAAIKKINTSAVLDHTQGLTDPRQRLQLLLDRNALIGRDVLISDDKLEQDCGDLIAFMEADGSTPAYLKSTPSGYQCWAPQSMSRPRSIWECSDLVSQLSPRMTAVSPALTEDDLSTVGLLQFAFGKPQNLTRYIVSGLLIGLAVGFLLSIGRDVGASRWIFSLGATGTVLGACLGVVSGGFRSGIAVMGVGTGLAMLTPTFNTVITNSALPDRDLGLLLQISLVLIAAGMTRVALEWIQNRDVLLTQHTGAARTQLAGMHRVLSLPTEFFRRRGIGELQLRFGAFEELRLEIQALMEGGLVRFVLTSTYVLFMLRISVKLTLLAIAISVLIVLPTTILALQSRPLQRHQEVAEAEAQSRNLELINSVSKLRLAGAEAPAARWWAERYQQVVNLENSLDIKEATAALLKNIMPNLGTLMIYIMITRLLAEAASSNLVNAPNIGQQLGFFAAFNTFIGGIAGLAGLFAGAFDLPVIYERARPLLDAEPEAQDNNKDVGILEGNLALDRVSYRYDNDRPLVLDGVSFEAKAGDYVAIVGPSGSGKSTLVRLLLGFATPENGTIRYDGRPLAGMELKSIRRQIGTVLQNNSLFSSSMMEAIAGGAVIQEEDAWHAAELAGLADDIRAMPMGMQTMIPEGGGTLSGGQRQRVVIARALVRKPRLLIFDEATSALDNHSQAVVTRSLDQLSITRVVIAHRLSTIRHADRIIVMDQGQVKEQGNYESLMANDGLFKRLMQRQIQ